MEDAAAPERAGWRDWALVLLSTVAGGYLLMGLALAITAVLDGSPIPATVGVAMVAACAWVLRWAVPRTVWRRETKRTGLTLQQRNRSRLLTEREVWFVRVGFPAVIVMAAVGVVAGGAYLGAGLPMLFFVPFELAVLPAHQRRQVLGR